MQDKTIHDFRNDRVRRICARRKRRFVKAEPASELLRTLG